MTRAEVVKQMSDVGLVPVIRAKSADALADIARALMAGGVPIAEVTMTVPGAIGGIRHLVKTFGKDLLVGVGSVTNVEQAEEAIDAGAQFVVSPVLVPAVIKVAQKHDTAVVPGAFTPTEIFTAYDLGSDVVKVYPSDLGGPGYIKALLAPMPFLKLMATGGVNLTTVGAFLKAGAVTLGAGAALVDARAIEQGDWAKLTDLARQFRDKVKEARA